MLGLLSLTTVKEWFWGGLVVAMGILALHVYHAGERHEVAALAAQSAKLVAQAQAQLEAQQADYNKQLGTLQERLNATIQADTAQHTLDAQRLRDFDAYRRAHPDVPSPSGGQGAGGNGAGGAQPGGDVFERLGSVALELADAVRAEARALNACVAERNALTGK